jgi:FkbM family methyltransferase
MASLYGRKVKTEDPREPAWMLELFAEELDSRPFTTYDAGAAGGLFSPVPVGHPRTLTVGFEPQPGSFAALEAQYRNVPRTKVFPHALSAEDGTATFYSNEVAPTLSSLMAERRAVDDGIQGIEVETVRIDSAADKLEIPSPDFLKLDTEGAELMILEGAATALSTVAGIYTEFSFAPNDPDEPSFRDLDDLLARAGFVLFDLQLTRGGASGVGGKKNRIHGGNALYLKDHYGEEGTAQDKRSALIRLIITTWAYRYADYALELAVHGGATGSLRADEATTLVSRLASIRDVAKVLPSFPGRERLAAVFDALSWTFGPQLKKGIPPLHNNLGNPRRTLLRRRPPAEITIRHPIGERHGAHPARLKIEPPRSSR